uniref:CAAX amino terminal protease family protein n=1 Tax=Rhizophora mucronata TaxID=61149 RepID=A0A2P2LSD1_RHIMU
MVSDEVSIVTHLNKTMAREQISDKHPQPFVEVHCQNMHNYKLLFNYLVLDDPISGRSRTRASVSLCEVSPFNADMATPVNAIASRAPKRPIPAHKIHPFCRLKGSLKSETVSLPNADKKIQKGQVCTYNFTPSRNRITFPFPIQL